MTEDNNGGAAMDGPAGRSDPSTEEAVMGWVRAALVGTGVFAYFFVVATWLPSALLRLGTVADSDQWVRDVVVTGTWLAALVVGLVGLRQAQRRGWI